MLPLQQAYEVKHSLVEYLRATFRFKDKGVHDAFYNFITHPEEGIFKGPYVSLRLPFVTAGHDAAIPLDIAPTFPPYHHQMQAFERLTTNGGHRPQSTLVTTGTSSGKTECFLYPILDYCHKHAGRKGIKVIILYPMNALATDQAKRLAEAIWNDNRLKGQVSAGLFIGEGRDKKHFESQMGETHIIENRTAIVENPPDILLTNFKMLDYATQYLPKQTPMYITNIKHFLGENGNIAADMNDSGRKMASFLAMIIDYSTSPQEEEMTDIDIRCNKRGCHGAILAEVNRSENTIYWGCTDCDHDGLISEWKGSKWDNSNR